MQMLYLHGSIFRVLLKSGKVYNENATKLLPSPLNHKIVNVGRHVAYTAHRNYNVPLHKKVVI